MRYVAAATVALLLLAKGAMAAPCLYDLSPLPVTKGVVSRITSGGVLLRDGTTIILPEGLLSSVREGRPLAVRGLMSVNGHTVRAFALDGQPPICPAIQDSAASGAYPGSPAYDVIHNGVSEAPG